MSENLGIVEPYELPVTEDTTPEPAPAPEPATVSEVDLSGYQYDIIPTYKMIEDPDDQDTLFRIQFLQAFGITTDEYHPEIVSAVINDLYERFHTNNGIREIIEAHPLYHSGLVDNSMDLNDENDNTDDTPPLSPSPHERRCAPKSENSEMIFCMMFSFQLFDLFHSCLRHAKHNEEIPKSIRDEIMECFRTMF
jgi:hypothetical protein